MILWISPQNEDKRNHELESFDANNYQMGRENEGSHSHGAACLSLPLPEQMVTVTDQRGMGD
jgi:hypothetical protein